MVKRAIGGIVGCILAADVMLWLVVGSTGLQILAFDGLIGGLAAAALVWAWVWA